MTPWQSPSYVQDNIPQYRSVKVVGAVKIKVLVQVYDLEGWVLHSEEMEPFGVSDFWKESFCPGTPDEGDPDGYYIRYSDGKNAYSPTKVFEAEYERIEQEQGWVND